MTAETPSVTGHENIPWGRIARLLIAQGSVMVGLIWLVGNVFGGYPEDIFVGAAVAAGGLVLLLWRRLHLSGRAVSVVAGLTAVTGTAAGLLERSAGLCCMFSYTEGRGWPYAWVGRGAMADEPGEAQRLTEASGWGVTSWLNLFVDVTVWAYTAVVLIVLFGLARRAVRR